MYLPTHATLYNDLQLPGAEESEDEGQGGPEGPREDAAVLRWLNGDAPEKARAARARQAAKVASRPKGGTEVPLKAMSK